MASVLRRPFPKRHPGSQAVVMQLHRSRYFGAGSWSSRSHQFANESTTDGSFFNGFKQAPISRLLVWDISNFHSPREIGPFEHGDAITHLGLQVSSELWDSLHEPVTLLGRLHEILDALPNLEALWLISDILGNMPKCRKLSEREAVHADRGVRCSNQVSRSNTHLSPSEDDFWEETGQELEEMEPCEVHVLQAARACPRLRYVRIYRFAWKIRVGLVGSFGDRADVQLERLDDWEDQGECPDVFYSPPPLAWSNYVRHSET
ncbi:hypothetical protein PWT90_10517 [Aphanocladium album]|nr:hypothetical protein PWT90_10517 [Aphanocladium album]